MGSFLCFYFVKNGINGDFEEGMGSKHLSEGGFVSIQNFCILGYEIIIFMWYFCVSYVLAVSIHEKASSRYGKTLICVSYEGVFLYRYAKGIFL